MGNIGQSNETFRQYCLRVEKKFAQFEKLAVTGEEQLAGTVVKYILLESCPSELRTFLVEHKVSKLSLSEFADLRVSFQDAQGGPFRAANAMPVEQL